MVGAEANKNDEHLAKLEGNLATLTITLKELNDTSKHHTRNKTKKTTWEERVKPTKVEEMMTNDGHKGSNEDEDEVIKSKV